jgi:voltage-gated potassium channel Kch
LRQDEFRAFQLLAAAPPEELQRLLLSADRFVGLATDVAIDSESRHVLLERFGVFGIRVAVELVRRGEVTTAPDLATALRRLSGLDDLRQVLHSQFAARREVLKARAGLVALDAVLRRSPTAASDRLAAEAERIEAGAHEIAELRLLNALRSGALDLPDADVAERLLANEGTEPWQRLGLDRASTRQTIAVATKASRSSWRRRAENPLSSKEVAEASAVLVRTCEGMLAAIEAVEPAN